MHARVTEAADRALAEQGLYTLRISLLFWRREHQGALQAHLIKALRQGRQNAGTEDNVPGQHGKFELTHALSFEQPAAGFGEVMIHERGALDSQIAPFSETAPAASASRAGRALSSPGAATSRGSRRIS